MANVVVMKTTYDEYGQQVSYKPVLYVDSINGIGQMAEVYGLTIRFIRENTHSVPSVQGNVIDVKRENHVAKDEKSISKKPNGYWFVADEKNRSLTLYKKTTTAGYLYSYPTVQKVFMLNCSECPKVVPQVGKKNTLFEDFSQELISKVAEHAKRTNFLRPEDIRLGS